MEIAEPLASFEQPADLQPERVPTPSVCTPAVPAAASSAKPLLVLDNDTLPLLTGSLVPAKK